MTRVRVIASRCVLCGRPILEEADGAWCLLLDGKPAHVACLPKEREFTVKGDT